MGTNKFRVLTMAAAVTVALSACSTTDDEATTTLSGVVADGYLQNATVCLDLNLNKACDADEPQATTGSDGSYSFDADEAASQAFPVISVITAETKDADDLTRVLEPYVMSAPAGKPEFISPMTTMIQTELESNPGMDVDAAETAVKTNLGYSATSTVSLFKDYVAAKKTDSTESAEDKAEYERIHRIAQVTARTLEANHKRIEDAATEAGLDKDALLNELVRLVVKDVIANLSTITAEVDKVELDATFDADAATTTADVSVDTGTLTDDIKAEEAVSAAVAINISNLLQDGIHFARSEFEDGDTEATYMIEKITLDPAISATELQFAAEIWNGTAWAAATDMGEDETRNCQAITATGLVTYGCDGAETIKDNGDGTASLEAKDDNGNVIETATIRGSKFDLAGTRVRAAVGDDFHFNKAIPGNAIFATGATGYRWNFTTMTDIYRVHYEEAKTGETCADRGYSSALTTTNCASLHGQNGPVAATALTDVTDGTTEYYVGNNMVATFTPDASDATMGAVNYIIRDYNTSPTTEKTIEGKYTVETPMGGDVSVILFEVPREFRHEQDDNRDAKSFIVIDEGYARMGGFRPGGVADADDDMSLDAAAVADLKDCFMGGTVTAGAGSCPVELFFRDGNLPLAEGESVAVSFDASKTMVPYTAPADGTIIDFSSDGTNSRWAFMFNANGTGTFTPASGSSAGTALAMTWKVTPNGRLKIERGNGDLWMVTDLDDGTTHVRRKRFDSTGAYEKNFGGYMTDLNAQ